MKKKETNYVESPPPDMEAINKALKQAEANRERQMKMTKDADGNVLKVGDYVEFKRDDERFGRVTEIIAGQVTVQTSEFGCDSEKFVLDPTWKVWKESQ